MSEATDQSAEIGQIVAALRTLSDELVDGIREGREAAAYACGAVDALADRLERVMSPASEASDV